MNKIFVLNLIFFLTLLKINGQKDEKVNILWISCEDISPTLAFYGDSTAKTPYLNALANESLIYDHAYVSTPVCGPSRSSIITGMLPTSIGTMHMRTAMDVTAWGREGYKEKVTSNTGIAVTDIKGDQIREYSAVVPSNVKCFTEYLRAIGYFCTNNQKTDYQFQAPQSAWDQNSPRAHWRNRPKGAPFFSVFNINETHESKLWEHEKLALTVDPQSIKVPPYFPDNSIIRRDLARHYSNVELLDKVVGKIIEELKNDGLYDQTIIVFFSDHGGPFPRQKRELNNAGLQVPLMIRFPGKTRVGRSSQLVSLMDLGPTMMSLVGIKARQHMEGMAFLGKYKKSARKHVFSTSDRYDEFTDRSRSVRDHRFLYVKNYYLDKSKYKHLAYRLKIPMMNEILRLKNEALLDKNQMHWFEPKEMEELYDCASDPHQLNNLANQVTYRKQLLKMRKLVAQKFDHDLDYGAIPEHAMVDSFWPNNEQPKTQTVESVQKNSTISLYCPDKNASISYIISDKILQTIPGRDETWKLYTRPFVAAKKQVIYAKAQRIGYKESGITEIVVE
jgi:arylsulfatase A-like enzyme